MKKRLLFIWLFSQLTSVLFSQFQKNGFNENWVPSSYDYSYFDTSDSSYVDPVRFDVTYNNGRVHILVEYDGNGNPIERKVFTYDPNGTTSQEEFFIDSNGVQELRKKEVLRLHWFESLPFQQVFLDFRKEWKWDNLSQSMELKRDDTSIVYSENGRFELVKFYGLEQPGGNRVLNFKKWIEWDGLRGKLWETTYLFNGDSIVSHRYDLLKDSNGKIRNLIYFGVAGEYVVHIDSWINEEFLIIKNSRTEIYSDANTLVPYSKVEIETEDNSFFEIKDFLWDGQKYILDSYERKIFHPISKELVSRVFEIPIVGVHSHDTLITTLDSEGRVLTEEFFNSQYWEPYVPRWKKVYSGHVSSQKEFGQDYLPRVFPNPCSEKIQFEKSPGPWLLMNTQGQSVFQSSGSKLEEDIQEVPPGNYFLVFSGTGLSKQLVVE